MGHGRRQRWLVFAAMLLIVGGGAVARPAAGQFFNPLRPEEELPAFPEPSRVVRWAGDRQALLTTAAQRKAAEAGVRSDLRIDSAEEPSDGPSLELAPAIPPASDSPLLTTPPLNPGVDDAPLTWPNDDPDSDPNVPGPLRQRLARLNRLLRMWTGIGADRSERYIGLGDPLTNTSWLNRPWSAGAFIGIQSHDHLISNDLAQTTSAIGGMRLGLDFDYYWGLELRYGYSNPKIFEPGTPYDLGTSHNYYVDLALMYYPWGDSRWRPYFSAGLGSATYRFAHENVSVSDSAFHVPLGIGLKYFYAPWLTLRFDAEYALAFGNESTDFQNEFMLGLGAEMRFGGRRTNYFPWGGNGAQW